MVRALWRRGVTSLLPTVVTSSERRMRASLEAISDARAADRLVGLSILGAHVEGPAISGQDGPRGAHPKKHVRPADIDEFRRWQEACGGLVRVVTLAPEVTGALALVRELAAAGVVPAIGHTAATPAQVRAAADAGARMSTHLGNGSHSELPRLDNFLWEQLADDRLWASLIFDGHHLPPAVMKTMLRAKGAGRCVLVSDAVALAGAPAGRYETPVGGAVVLEPEGRLVVEGTHFLAGSVVDLLTGVANAVSIVGTPLPQAVSLASANPARLLGLDHDGGLGRTVPGYRADITAFTWPPGHPRPELVATVVAGQVVYRAESEAADSCVQ